jgi:hypothetical protein
MFVEIQGRECSRVVEGLGGDLRLARERESSRVRESVKVGYVRHQLSPCGQAWQFPRIIKFAEAWVNICSITRVGLASAVYLYVYLAIIEFNLPPYRGRGFRIGI